MDTDKIKIDINQIPKASLDSLCRATLEACKRFYADPKNVECYENWKKEQEQKQGGVD